MQQTDFLFAGFGGQGIMFAGQLLAYAAMDAGLNVTWIPSYGPEMRGGTANCTVIISRNAIGSPIVQHPQTAVIFNTASYAKYEPLVARDGLLVYNASLIDAHSSRTDIIQLPVDASKIAEELGTLKLMNMVMLGAALAARPMITLETVYTALKAHLPAHRSDLLPLNKQALETGFAVASGALALP